MCFGVLFRYFYEPGACVCVCVCVGGGGGGGGGCGKWAGGVQMLIFFKCLFIIFLVLI